MIKTLMIRSAFFLTIGSLASIVGCGGGSKCDEGQVECDDVCIAEIAPTLAAIQTDVFQGSCAVADSCHRGLLAAEMLDLSSIEASEDNLLGDGSGVPSVQDDQRLRVDPGNSDDSYLMNKLDGVNLALTSGGNPSTQMPQTGTLCDAKIEAVRAWIDSGAN